MCKGAPVTTRSYQIVASNAFVYVFVDSLRLVWLYTETSKGKCFYSKELSLKGHK